MVKRALTLTMSLGLALALSGCAASDFKRLFGWPPDLAPAAERADLIVVEKEKRRLELYRRNKLIAAYDVELGFAPKGHKLKLGDGKTPEGRYRIVHRNAESKFHLSLALNYPNEADKTAAAVRGEDPGGNIVIHGGSRLFDPLKGVLRDDDWTDGCVALTNAEMEEVWARVAVGTPIEIRP